jgi:hypothetical protein
MADLGFIADLWFDRSEEPNKPMRLVDIIKASFGGDRSAAGRYAAEQRWKNHQKKKEDKKGIFVSSALRNQLSLSRDALKNFENDGGSLRRYPDVLSKEDDKALSAEITKLWLQADKFGRRLEESSDFSEEMKAKKLTAVARTQEAARLAELALEAMGKPPFDERWKQELVVARDRNGELTGLMLVQIGMDENTEKMMMMGSNSSVDVTGRGMEIAYLVSFQTQKGMGSALFGQALKDAAGKNVVQISLEWTAKSKPFWTRIGFDRQYLSSSMNAFLNVRVDEIATLLV